MNESAFNVVIVGAGPAGLGCALALQEIGVESLVIVESERVGASFQHWPEEMRLITPSFHSNPFFATDLNAVSPRTSPGDLFGAEHLSGKQYAAYLKAVVGHYELPVREGCRVNKVRSDLDGFTLEVYEETIKARFVIWATGEFSFPDLDPFPGAGLCRIAPQVGSWQRIQGDEFVVIGGYESGMDAAYHLAARGSKVKVLSRGEPWKIDDPDPSVSLSPFTKERLARIARALPGSIELLGGREVIEVTHDGGAYRIFTLDGDSFVSSQAPILATGFEPGIKRQVSSFFEWNQSRPVFSEVDSSTLYPNLFYSGPSLLHRDSKFCFIYKFRARFGVIAQEIGKRLELDTSSLSEWKKRGFLIEDIDCCVDCKCEVETSTVEEAVL
ncbi:NAD(P)-binding domain-containing protein [Puniceicoccaceae bacterium K14]|nr:NAD(P)-binding domain-containing protein [Puniceicoccaceae bacterium K14]